MSRKRNFVLVHGAGHGGWCWSRVRDQLEEHGHRVFTPTLTGLGERSHLLSADITLQTHIDDVANAWEEDATIRDLVARLAARRTPLDDAQKAIANIVTGSESERQKKAKLIFAGLFKTLNDERSDVMRGIERHARKQKEFSDQIRSAILQLRELQDRPDADQGRIDELTNRVEWDTRIFEERRKTMNFVCEVPVLIEQRLFALARAIQQSLE